MDFGGFWEATWEGKPNQDRSKIASKWHRKNDEKMGASWRVLGGIPRARDGRGGPEPPPFSPFSKNQTNQNQSTDTSKDHLGTPCAQARWRITIVLEGFSRPSEDGKIEEKSIKNGPKFEVQNEVPLGIEF